MFTFSDLSKPKKGPASKPKAGNPEVIEPKELEKKRKKHSEMRGEDFDIEDEEGKDNTIPPDRRSEYGLRSAKNRNNNSDSVGKK